jgi:hypothetical protein
VRTSGLREVRERDFRRVDESREIGRGRGREQRQSWRYPWAFVLIV